MSPEQARGESVDKRTDIWAFGCVFFEMLTGRAAFGGDTFSDTLVAILQGEPEWTALPAMPGACEAPAATLPGEGSAASTSGYRRCAVRARPPESEPRPARVKRQDRRLSAFLECGGPLS